jgi:hypothetical protein
MTKPKSKMLRVHAQGLRIHPVAQRDILPSKQKRMIEELDLDAIGVFHAVQYEINGEFAVWVIDGQHRLSALMAHGFGEWVVDVKVHLDVTDDARASALFLKLNDRSVVCPYDKFKNEVTAGDTVARGVRDLVVAHAVRVAKEPGDGKVRCVMSMKRVYGFDGGVALGRTLDTVIAAWGRTETSMDGKIIEGLGLLFKAYGDAIDQAALAKKLAKYPGGASAVLGDARGLRTHRSGAVARCVAEVVIDLYNSGRRNGKLDPL